jgi:hypothetical protein
VMAAIRQALTRWRGQLQTSWTATDRRAWTTGDHLGVAAATAAATLVGAWAVIGGMRGLRTIPQDWDAVFHANGIRWIAEHGDAGLFGMSQVNWYEPGTAIFYPNAYHVLGATIEQLTGRDIPSVLNAQTALLPGLAALVLAALVRRLGGSPLHAAATALAAVTITALYDTLWRGPLLPYTTGVVLTPVLVLLLAEFLDSTSRRQAVVRGLVTALGAAGLVCIHPAMLFGAVVLGAPYLVFRWAGRPATLRREPLFVVGAAVVAVALCSLQISGSLYSAASFPPVDWPADLTWSVSTWALLGFSHAASTPQIGLTVFGAIGLLLILRRPGLRWIVVPAIVFGGLFVLTASSDAPWVNAVTRPWWNDRWRLIALFALVMCVVIGYGVDRLGAFVAWVLRRLFRDDVRLTARTAGAVAAAVALLALVGGTKFLSLGRNEFRMGYNTGGPAVSALEQDGLEALGRIVPPGVRVMNDRNDGSVWMYALSDTLPVAGHYDATALGGTDVSTLERGFDEYLVNPQVRDAVARLGVGYVVVGEGFLRGDAQRAAGLVDLDGQPFLEEVYANPDFRAYRIVAPGSG